MQHVYKTLDRLKHKAFSRWCTELRYGETPRAEAARQEYNALVDISNDWMKAGPA